MAKETKSRLEDLSDELESKESKLASIHKESTQIQAKIRTLEKRFSKIPSSEPLRKSSSSSKKSEKSKSSDKEDPLQDPEENEEEKTREEVVPSAP